MLREAGYREGFDAAKKLYDKDDKIKELESKLQETRYVLADIAGWCSRVFGSDHELTKHAFLALEKVKT